LKKTIYILTFLFTLTVIYSFTLKEEHSYKIGVLKYKGGGDWYANPTALTNLAKYCNKNLGMNINPEVAEVDVSSVEIFNYPFIHMTGHGNVVFSSSDIENLRVYLLSGGFLHIDDNYGMDKFVRAELKKIFPNKELVELPFSHKIYHQKYNFEKGLPKVHEHDNKAPQGFGIFEEDRLLVFYSYECDLGDGWEDQEVHNDPADLREKALQMGANIVQFAFTDN
jgi:hypothetical protein